MKYRSLFIVLLALTGCVTVRSQPAQKWLPTLEEEKEREYATAPLLQTSEVKPWTLPPGALASISELPPLQLEVFGQAMAPLGTANCSSPSAACLVASLTSSGAVSGTTGTFTTSLVLGTSNSCTVTAAGTAVTVNNCDLKTSNVGTDIVSARGVISQAGSGVNAISAQTNGARFDFGAGASDYMSSDGTYIHSAAPFAIPSGSALNLAYADSHSYLYRSASNTIRVGTSAGGGSLIISGNLTSDGTSTLTGAVTASSTTNKGTITLAAGTGTATVTSGAKCVCGTETANAVRCAVAATTLTCTGTGTEACNYICL